MKTRKLEIWVGIFVVLSIAALLMLALQVSGLGCFYNTTNSYTVSAAFENIGALKNRSKITIGGVTIGRVESITLKVNDAGDYQAVVELEINDKFSEIPDDSSAKILTAGLLGDNYVAIVPGHSEAYLQDGSNIELTSQAVLLEDLISKFATSGN